MKGSLMGIVRPNKHDIRDSGSDGLQENTTALCSTQVQTP